ncbi:thiamine phosphate synthase [candidate division WOR-3 bacterium]|nr:thiamine phosphate synthase [candidate division WOR-3 bacterium]
MLFLRIIDVNLNRLTESLKLIEDITRFHIGDRNLLSRTRKIRKELLQIKRSTPIAAFINARQSRSDLGRKATFDSRRMKSSSELILSNLTRAKEASRTLEEIFKATDIGLSNRLKDIRFKIYDLEKDIIVWLQKKFDPYLCAIIDGQYLMSHNVERITKTLVNNGATMIQLRVKETSDRDFLGFATRIRKAIAIPEVKFIVNDRPDIALACDADGVHLGQYDMEVSRARQLMGEMAIIGMSAHSPREAARGEAGGADYLGVGAVFPTSTKNDARPCTLATLRQICRSVRIPVIGIGGIRDTNFRSVLRAGAAGIAVASFLFEGNLKQRIRSLTRR